jgi:hypothetical protein
MKDDLKATVKDMAVGAIAITFVVIFFIAVTYTRFTNPELTETQLFLAYWPLYSVCLVAAAIFGLVLTRQTK